MNNGNGVGLTLPERSQQIWVLADGDSFYASCEIARRPHLRWKIVIVERLDICMAASYEAKALWIWLTTPLREVHRMLKGKEHYIFKADMGYYERVSDTVFGLIHKHSNCMERFSVDECFYNRTWIVWNGDEAVATYARQLQEHIMQTTGMPVTFGFARTRLVAKMFCKFRKPYGIFWSLNQDAIAHALAPLPVQHIPFIGKKRAQRLWSISTVKEFMDLEWAYVRQLLKRDGLKLRLELHWYTALNILRKWWPSSIGRMKSFHPHFTSDLTTLWWKFMVKFEQAYAQLIQEKVAPKLLAVMLRPKDLQQPCDVKKMRLPNHTTERTFLLRMFKRLFEWARIPWRLYRGTGLYFAELIYQEHRELSLFETDTIDTQREAEQHTIQTAIDTINRTLWWQHIVRASSASAINKVGSDEFQMRFRVR